MLCWVQVRLTFASGLALFPLLPQQLVLELAGPGAVVVVTSLVQLLYGPEEVGHLVGHGGGGRGQTWPVSTTSDPCFLFVIFFFRPLAVPRREGWAAAKVGLAGVTRIQRHEKKQRTRAGGKGASAGFEHGKHGLTWCLVWSELDAARRKEEANRRKKKCHLFLL